MNHLETELLIAVARGQSLPDPAAAHLAGCAACRTRAQAWGNVAAAARQAEAARDEVPLPSFDALLAPALAAASRCRW